MIAMSCNKENERNSHRNLEESLDSDLAQAGTRTDENVLNSIVENNGILEFSDFTHFQNAVTYLEDQIENHIDNFVTTYDHLDDDQLFDKEQELNFSDFKPAEDFENMKGFSSRRAFVENAIKDWLNNAVLDDANDPDDWDDWDDLDEEMRTFFNEDGNVKIGGDIYHMDDFLGVEGTLNDGCKRHRVEKTIVDYTNKKRFKIRVAATSGPLRLVIKTKVVSQRKKWGVWWRFKTNVFASVGGSISDDNCLGGIGVAALRGPKKRRRIKAKHVDWDPETWHKFKSGYVSGNGWAASSNNLTGVVLNW